MSSYVQPRTVGATNASSFHTASEALALPRGQLFLEPQCVEFNFTKEMVLAAAAQLIRRNVPFYFDTQAQVISHAQGGSENVLGSLGTQQLVRAVPLHATANKRVYSGGVCQLKTPIEALRLPRGQLSLGLRGLGTMTSPAGTIIPVPFDLKSVLACAAILIKKGDTRVYHTQSDVIAAAGNAYGWGAGRDYFSSK